MGVGNSKSELEISKDVQEPIEDDPICLPDERSPKGETASSIHRSSDSTDSLTSEEADQSEDPVQLSDTIWMFPNKRISNHGEIFEGELRSGTYGIRPIVLKLVPNIKQSITEANIHAKLGNHSHILSVIESDVCPNDPFGRIFIALDKCHNENLRMFIEKRKNQGIPFDSDLANEFCKQLVVGVTCIHENKIIHKDIKPENIFLSLNQKTIKIADFGLSQEIDSVSTVVFIKQQFGTDGFRPAESFGKRKISQKSDIFSLGTTFYFVLSDGENPFGDDFDLLNHNVQNSKFDLSHLLVSNVKTVQHLIKHMIAPKLNDRPTIWQVSEHPCWTGEEDPCDFDYHCDESSESSDSSDEESPAHIAQDVFTLLAKMRHREETAKLQEEADNTPRKAIMLVDATSEQSVIIQWVEPKVTVHTYRCSLYTADNHQLAKEPISTSHTSVKFSDLRPKTCYYGTVESVKSGRRAGRSIRTNTCVTSPGILILNDVSINKETGWIESFFCKDQKTREQHREAMKAEHIHLRSREIIVELGDKIAVNIHSTDNPIIWRMEYMGNHQLMITENTLDKFPHVIYFRPISHITDFSQIAGAFFSHGIKISSGSGINIISDHIHVSRY